MQHTLTPTLRSFIVLLVSLTLFLSYSFINAAWTAAPANPPESNSPSPINTGTSTASIQNAGQGALQFDFLGARDTVIANGTMRSDAYCNLDGTNCLSIDDLMSIQTHPPVSVTRSGSVTETTSYNSSYFCSVGMVDNGGCDGGFSCGISLQSGSWQINQTQHNNCDYTPKCTYTCMSASPTCNVQFVAQIGSSTTTITQQVREGATIYIGGLAKTNSQSYPSMYFTGGKILGENHNSSPINNDGYTTQIGWWNQSDYLANKIIIDSYIDSNTIDKDIDSFVVQVGQTITSQVMNTRSGHTGILTATVTTCQ
jgi:hypothetical protein